MKAPIGLVCLVAALAGAAWHAEALENGLARTPPMGWLSWARFTCTIDCKLYPNDCINSQLYRSMADKLVERGYAKLGYEYVNIDDCWSEMARNSSSHELVADAARFPEDIGGLAKYMHDRQLKLGIYGDCGTATCAGYPAQLKSESNLEDNYFELDASTLARWQVDSFKFDGCNIEPPRAESICPRMADALAATQRPVLVTCEWPFYMLRDMYNFHKTKAPDFELAARACNTWRYFEDVEDSWLSILNIINFTIKIQHTIVKFHGPGHWFDPDQLVIGDFALSLDQARAQMAIWSVWSAPLYMSNDLRDMLPEMEAVLKNEQLIAVDQDPLGVFGLMVAQENGGKHQAFAKPVLPIKSGCPSFVVVYLNRDTLGNSRDLSFKVRALLTGLPIELAARRYNDSLAAATGQFGGSPLDAQQCMSLLRFGMTQAAGSSSKALLNKPVNQPASQISVEELPVSFAVLDLFGDDPKPASVTLDGQLKLRVNPSGVRAVKLIMQAK